MKKLICTIMLIIALLAGCAAAETSFWVDSDMNPTGMMDTPYAYSAACWAVQGDTVYFYDNNALGGEKLLYRIDTTGDAPADIRRVLLPGTGEPAPEMRCMMPSGTMLLFISQNDLYVLDMPTDTVYPVYPGVSCAWYADGWAYVFHQDFGTAVWSRTDGVTTQQIADMRQYTSLSDDYNKTFDVNGAVVHDGYVYIAGNSRDPLYPGKVYKVALDGSGAEMLLDEYALANACDAGWLSIFDVDHLFVHEGKLFILLSGGMDRSYRFMLRCELDGSDAALLSQDYPRNIVGCVDGWLIAEGAYDLSGLGNAEYADSNAMHRSNGIESTKLMQGDVWYENTDIWYNAGNQYITCTALDGSGWALYRGRINSSDGEVIYAQTYEADFAAIQTIGTFEDLVGTKVYFYSDGTCLVDYGNYEEMSTYEIDEEGNFIYVEYPNEVFAASCIVRPDQIVR